MPSDDQQNPRPGSVPNAFGNALAWRWTREMPPRLKGGFLTALYALRAMAAPSGELRFAGDRTPLRIQDLARAAGCREQDVRRYLDAAILAGVLTSDGPRKRGRATLYRLVVTPWPDWQAALDHVAATARPRNPFPRPAAADRTGHDGPNPTDGAFGPPRAEPEMPADRAAVAPRSSGPTGSTGSGRSGPDTPGVTQEETHEMAAVRPQPPQPPGPRASTPRPAPAEPEALPRCATCPVPLLRPGRTHCHGCEQRLTAPSGPRRRDA
ncbi:hypothetical protein [Streptomyces sp. NPDC058374]|uniref:hypothetical protein n=1 Tax=unclassified Streptomyces TaxID=2593676 RepID=UPI0036698E9F